MDKPQGMNDKEWAANYVEKSGMTESTNCVTCITVKAFLTFLRLNQNAENSTHIIQHLYKESFVLPQIHQLSQLMIPITN